MNSRHSIFIAIFLLSLYIGPTSAAWINGTSTNDSYVHQANPNNNYRTNTEMYIGSGGENGDFQTYVKFDLTGTKRYYVVDSATLYLYKASTSGGTNIGDVGVYNVSADWTDATITYNNMPAVSISQDTINASDGLGTWQSWDVTSGVQAYIDTGTNYGFAVSDSVIVAGVSHGYYSKDYTSGKYAPRLNISYSSLHSGVAGVVYGVGTNGATSPLSGATVRVYNDTWSSKAITNSRGEYTFYNLTNLTTYYLQAKKPDYEDGDLEIITTANASWIEKDLLINKCVSGFNCFYTQHYVKFIVQNWFGTIKYPNITVSVYKGADVTTTYSGTTGTDGAYGVLLTNDQSYRVTFINSSQSIDELLTITPTKDDTYYIIVSSAVNPWQTNTTYTQVGTVDTGVTTSTINSTHSWVNISYSDGLNQTTALLFYINQTNHTMPTRPQIIVSSFDAGVAGNYTHNFTVLSGGRSYLANVVATHTTFGTVYRSYGINFPGLQSTAADFIPAYFKTLIAMAFMLFMGAVFGETRRAQGAGVVCVLGWVFLGFGWFSYFSSTTSIVAGLTVASFVVLMWNFNERKNAEGVS